MIRYGTQELSRIVARLREEETAVPFFQSLDLRSEQEQYWIDRGVDGGRRFSDGTRRARARRWGYYRKQKRSRVSASRPYGVWTGRLLRSTYGEGAGRKRIRPGLMTIRAMGNRPVRNYWDLPTLDRKLGNLFEARLQRVLNGLRPRRRVVVGRVS